MSKKLTFLEVSLTLRDQGVEVVKIEYSGSGDSGDIDDVEYYRNFDYRYYTGDHVDLEHKSEINDVIMNHCYDNILNRIEDWYNDDGGYGTIIINLSTGEYTCDNSIRIIETYAHEGEFNFEV